MLPVIPAELTNFLRTEADRARDVTLDDARAVAIKAYFGEPYGDEEDGRSQAVTRDVSEVTDIMLVGILSAVLAGGKAVEFDTEPEEVPAPTEQDPQAVQTIDYGAEATAAVHYQFMRKQPGYRILHDAAKAGLLEKTGITKTYPYPQRAAEVTVEVPGAALVEDGDGWALADGTPVLSAAPVDDEAAALDPLNAPHSVTIAQEQPRIIRDLNVPNEWFLIAPDAVELDEAVYVGDKRPVSVSDLVELGFDQADVEPLWSATDSRVVADARDTGRGQTDTTVGQRTGPQKRLWMHHEFPLFDLDGDGIAERLDVLRIGMVVLRAQPADEQPYSGWSPVPMQHRFTGQSMADKPQDIQRIRSVLLRQGLDSIYLMNAPRTAISEDALGENTIDDLLTVRAGAIIRYRGAIPPTPYVGGDTSAVSFQAMEAIRGERDARTGVTGQSQGLNPDTLNKTASGMAMLQQNADQIELYVTRNLVEQLLLPMFARRYRLMRQHQAPFRMKIDGKYRQVDPSKWPDEPDMNINVGLGTGSKDQRLAYRLQLGSIQAQLAQGNSRLIGEQQAYNSIRAFVEDASLGVATDYVQDPSQLPPAPDPVDPQAVEAQGKAALAQQQSAQDHEQTMAKLELQARQQDAQAALNEQAAQQAADLKVAAAAEESQLRRDRAAEEARLAEDRQVFEMELSERRFAFDQEMARKKAQQADASDDSIPGYRPGGDLAE